MNTRNQLIVVPSFTPTSATTDAGRDSVGFDLSDHACSNALGLPRQAIWPYQTQAHYSFSPHLVEEGWERTFEERWRTREQGYKSSEARADQERQHMLLQA